MSASKITMFQHCSWALYLRYWEVKQIIVLNTVIMLVSDYTRVLSLSAQLIVSFAVTFMIKCQQCFH